MSVDRAGAASAPPPPPPPPPPPEPAPALASASAHTPAPQPAPTPAPAPAPPPPVSRPAHSAASNPLSRVVAGAHLVHPMYSAPPPHEAGYPPLPSFGLDLGATHPAAHAHAPHHHVHPAHAHAHPHAHPHMSSPRGYDETMDSSVVSGPDTSRVGMPLKPKSKKRAKTRIDDADRQRICQHAAANPGMKQGDIAALFCLERSTVSKILKNKDRYLAMQLDESFLTRDRTIRRPALEGKLLAYVHWMTAEGAPPPDNHMLRAKATEIDMSQRAAQQEGDASTSNSGSNVLNGSSDLPFVPSDAWLSSFRARHRLLTPTPASEADESTSSNGKRAAGTHPFMPAAKRRSPSWNEPSPLWQAPMGPLAGNAPQWHSTPPPQGPISLRDADSALATLLQFLREQPEGLLPPQHHFVLGHLQATISRLAQARRGQAPPAPPPALPAAHSQAQTIAGHYAPPGSRPLLPGHSMGTTSSRSQVSPPPPNKYEDGEPKRNGLSDSPNDSDAAVTATASPATANADPPRDVPPPPEAEGPPPRSP